MRGGEARPGVKAPYPGLRPFEPEEHKIFFGRGDQIDQMLAALEEHRFLAVVGASGSGKSSLVRAGLVPALEAGFLSQGGSSWTTVLMRPGGSPFARLAERLQPALAAASDPSATADADRSAFLEATLRGGPKGLVEAVRDARLPEGTSLLLVVDQFEELFRTRYGRGETLARESAAVEEPSASQQRNEATAFVSLLLATARQSELPIYVVITMRSDFIGDCDAFRDLPEAVSQSQFLTPRLIRQQLESAITGPAELFGGSVEPGLVQSILNEIGPEGDQLPVMQHALMRIWAKAVAEAGGPRVGPRPESPHQDPLPREEEDGQAPIVMRLAHLEQVGGLREALSRHADEAYDELDADQRRVAEWMFRCLCDRPSQHRLTRRLVSVAEVAAVAGASVEQVCGLVEVFRRPDRSFLTPPAGTPLVATTVLDISHESLIRQWTRLGDWVRKEGDSAATYLHLVQTARLWEADKAGLWGFPDLDVALEWRRKESPTAAWADRYGGQFELALRFLEESLEARRRHEEQQRRERNRRVRHLRFVVTVVSLLAAALLGVVYWYRDAYIADHVTYWANFQRSYGIPGGLGPLTPSQVGRRAYSFKLTRNGRLGPLRKVQAVNGSGELTTRHNLGTYLRSASEDQIPQRICVWEYAYDQSGKIVYEMARDRLEGLVWGLVYSPREAPRHARAHYVGPDGYPQPQRKSKAAYVEIDYDDRGHETLITFTDAQAQPMPGPDGAYAMRRQYDERGLCVKLASLGADGRPMVDASGNCGQIYERDDAGNYTRTRNLDTQGRLTAINDGWVIEEDEHDTDGNLTRVAYYDADHHPVRCKDGYHVWALQYDEHGNRSEDRYFDENGAPTVDNDGEHRLVKRHNRQGNVIEMAFFGVAGEPVRQKDGSYGWSATFDPAGNKTEIQYLDENRRPYAVADGYAKWTRKFDERGHETEWAFFGPDDRPTWLAGYHRRVRKYDPRGNEIECAYYDTQDRPCRHQDGFHKWTAQYDDRGNEIECAYFDEQDRRCRHRDGYHEWKAQFDERGNRLEVAVYDEQRLPCRTKEGYHKSKSKFDRENEIQRAFFDEDDRPCRNNEGYHRWKATPDERGKEIQRAFFDGDGHPCLCSDGYHLRTITLDWRGTEVERSFFDVDGKTPLRDAPLGVHTVKKTFDAYGRETAESYFDERDGPLRSKILVHDIRYTFDPRGNLLEVAYFDEHDQPCRRKEGYQKWKSRFNERSREIQRAYFDEHDQPVRLQGDMRVQGWTAKYDEHGKETERVYFDEQGPGHPAAGIEGGCTRLTHRYNDLGAETETTYYYELAPHKDGYAREVRKLDLYGQAVEKAFFDLAGKPVRLKDGYHLRTIKYDPRGNVVEVAYFDEQRRPARHVDGNHGWTVTYDREGREIERAYFDEQHHPVGIDDGYTRLRYRYAESGRKIETTLDYEVKPHANGYSREIRKFDARKFPDGQDRVIEKAFFDLAGKPVPHKDGYFLWRAVYDEQGNQVEVAFFNEYGLPQPQKGVAQAGFQYGAGRRLTPTISDERGRSVTVGDDGYTRVAYRYEHGVMVEATIYYEAAPHADGYAREIRRFDGSHRVVARAFFDFAGKPVRHKNGSQLWKAQYDAQGHVVEVAYFDEQGRPARIEDGYSRVTYRYDQGGHRIEAAYYYEAGPHADGYAREVWKLDLGGHAVEKAFFDLAGKPVRQKDGSHLRAIKYDALGHVIEVAFFDQQRRPIRQTDGAHGWTITYNSVGREIERAYFDEQHRPVGIGDGYTRVDYRYDERGRKIENTYYYEVKPHADGYSKEVQKLDARKFDDGRERVIEKAFFDLSGKPLRHKNGYHLWKAVYEEQGNQVEVAYFDLQGRPTLSVEGYHKEQVAYDAQRHVASLTFYDTDNRANSGIKVLEVFKGGQGAALGLQPGDVILRYAAPCVDIGKLIAAIRAPGAAPRELVVQRAGREVRYEARPGPLNVVLGPVFGQPPAKPEAKGAAPVAQGK